MYFMKVMKMSKLLDIIFDGGKYELTSPYGDRDTINTKAGKTGSFHNGADYATFNKKLPQYAVEDGTVLSCGTDYINGEALYVWVAYPRTGKKLLHYHLDTIAVKAGQQVSKGTLIGTTGMTGKATGIHLHLGVKDLITDQYEDPEKFAQNYTEPVEYLKKGDHNSKVLAYKGLLIALRALGIIKQAVDNNNIFGSGTEKATKQLQRAAGLTEDGFVGPKTKAAALKLLSEKFTKE